MSPRVDDLKRALAAMSRDDLDGMTVEELGSLECDLLAWANLALVAMMGKRSASQSEVPE